jgi:hypothetical protein
MRVGFAPRSVEIKPYVPQICVDADTRSRPRWRPTSSHPLQLLLRWNNSARQSPPPQVPPLSYLVPQQLERAASTACLSACLPLAGRRARGRQGVLVARSFSAVCEELSKNVITHSPPPPAAAAAALQSVLHPSSGASASCFGVMQTGL